jgi:hypothetical protein
MIYRKSSPTPPRLLLRIVATAGAGTLLAVAACSSRGAEGLSPDAPTDASDTDGASSFGGSMVNPDAALNCGDEGSACYGGGGIFIFPPDGGDAGDGDAAMSPDADADVLDGSPVDAAEASADATSDAAGPCHPCGVVVRPDE